MDAIEAILTRYSARSFKPDPVPKETVLKILEAALHSPSSGNSQPWEIFVAGGAVADKIRKGYLDRFNRDAPPLPEMSGVPVSQWPTAMR